jgi:hypothetical protein
LDGSHFGQVAIDLNQHHIGRRSAANCSEIGVAKVAGEPIAELRTDGRPTAPIADAQGLSADRGQSYGRDYQKHHDFFHSVSPPFFTFGWILRFFSRNCKRSQAGGPVLFAITHSAFPHT